MATQKAPTGTQAFKSKLQTVGSQLALTARPKTMQPARNSNAAHASKASSQSERRLEKANRASKWLLPQDRDCRSWVVSEYDAHQEMEKERHQALLEKISKAEY
ncbi:hypothetical protein HYFRA_00004078 [Hymenoscyphus fraxineus]|uniref:Uncharacterized protein n=1 Tax=Hymenoscyphus fraxineus TaxID=746836 RepID=A0A9N9KML9_9HELO|nr:hypothetical protein HYFRA_00004078 [Hymenoscyphus fraxineus]